MFVGRGARSSFVSRLHVLFFFFRFCGSILCGMTIERGATKIATISEYQMNKKKHSAEKKICYFFAPFWSGQRILWVLEVSEFVFFFFDFEFWINCLITCIFCIESWTESENIVLYTKNGCLAQWNHWPASQTMVIELDLFYVRVKCKLDKVHLHRSQLYSSLFWFCSENKQKRTYIRFCHFSYYLLRA